MGNSKRVFILGAGFSKPAGMPLATELLPLLVDRVDVEEMRKWLEWLRERLAWLTEDNPNAGSLDVNIEQVFHFAHFDIEAHRLRQHLAPVGRGDGPATPWNQAHSIEAWLSYLEEALRDVLSEQDDSSDLHPITRWSRTLNDDDAVLTFNYDTLSERAISETGRTWNHGFECDGGCGSPVFKLHGSIDWIVADRCESFSKLDLLFDEPNSNRSGAHTGTVEDDARLWRCRNHGQMQRWIRGRGLQSVPKHALIRRTVGIAGLGAYKELHQVPGLGRVWARGMRTLYEADHAVVVGFAMSDFDAMAQMQFAELARARHREDRPLPVTVIDPCTDEQSQTRFRRVFRKVSFVPEPHESFDWSGLHP
ncbi:MAG: hypothetical protein PVI86_18830 [Phycisphaerae bacterium]|jgi:hypothetical protein